MVPHPHSRRTGPRFALAGSYALRAYGAPRPSHAVDLVVAECDVAPTGSGLSAERRWLRQWLRNLATNLSLVRPE